MTDILADNTDPAENSIWGSRFQLQTDEGRRPATLKTGTTNDFRDLQAFGFLAPDADPTVDEGALVTGVWVGNSDFSAIADVFAADGPTFIWHDYMAEVTAAADLPLRDFPRPDGIVEVQVDAMSGLLPGDLTRTTVTEIFATSNQPQEQDTLHERLRIEDESGKIWQEGCGDQRETESGAAGDLPEPGRLGARLPDLGAGQPTLDRAVAWARGGAGPQPGPAPRRAAGAHRDLHAGRVPDLDPHAVAVTDPEPDARGDRGADPRADARRRRQPRPEATP